MISLPLAAPVVFEDSRVAVTVLSLDAREEAFLSLSLDLEATERHRWREVAFNDGTVLRIEDDLSVVARHAPAASSAHARILPEMEPTPGVEPG